MRTARLNPSEAEGGSIKRRESKKWSNWCCLDSALHNEDAQYGIADYAPPKRLRLGVH